VKERELFALFKIFLEMNGALEGYLVALQETYSNYPHTNRFRGRDGIERDFIFGGFIWAEAAQGHSFWSELNSKWHKVLKDVKNNQKSR
jgi:hypothetical protein